MGLKGINVDGTEYKIDYSAIENPPQELPSVTTSDNGKFLRVVNGKWTAQSISSAEGVSY